MNILAAADLHGRHEWYEVLIETAGTLDVQAIVLAGDLLGYDPDYARAADAQAADAQRLLAILARSVRPVLYVLGNDDLVDLGPDSVTLRSIHGRRVDLGTFNFLGYRYTLPFMAGDFEKPEEGIAQDLESIAELADERTVLVTHSPALGHLDLTMLGTHAGSASILAFVERMGVRAHIHGHLHSGFGRDGRHFNVAALQHGKAMWIDLERMFHQEISLAIEKSGRMP